MEAVIQVITITILFGHFVSPVDIRDSNSPRFSIRKISQLNPELGKKCSEMTNKMLKITKHS